MATYHEFCDIAGRFGGMQVNQDVWRFDLQGRGQARVQKVFVFHELMQPDFEFLLVKSAFAQIAAVECAQVLKGFGQLHVGAIGYSPSFDAQGNEVDGFLTISSSVPLAALDLSEPTTFLLYLNLVAQAADHLEQQFGGSGLPDAF